MSDRVITLGMNGGLAWTGSEMTRHDITCFGFDHYS